MTPNLPSSVVLAIDTSAAVSSVALCSAETILARAQLGVRECRGEALGSLVEGLLEAGFTDVAELAGLAVVVGPGSYTGLRIGLALARGLALVDRLAVVPFGSLELLAMSASPRLPAERIALLAAGRDKFYAGAYRVMGHRVEVVVEPDIVQLADPAELTAFVARAGSAAMPLCIEAGALELLPAGFAAGAVVVEVARASVAGLAAVARLADGVAVAAETVMPVYTGGSSARPNRNGVILNDAVVK